MKRGYITLFDYYVSTDPSFTSDVLSMRLLTNFFVSYASSLKPFWYGINDSNNKISMHKNKQLPFLIISIIGIVSRHLFCNKQNILKLTPSKIFSQSCVGPKFKLSLSSVKRSRSKRIGNILHTMQTNITTSKPNV